MMLLSLMMVMQGAAIAPSPAASTIQQVSLVAIEDQKDATIPPKSCLDEQNWCLTVYVDRSGEQNRYSLYVDHGIPEAEVELPDDMTEVHNGTLEFWEAPIAYQSPSGTDALLFGLIQRQSEGYSGGGASEMALHLYRAEVSTNDKLEVTRLDDAVPFGGSALIRACFSENDMKLRRNMCHDDYSLDVSITPTGKLSNGLPELVYTSIAEVTPGFASRMQDNSDPKLLTRLTDTDFEKRIDDRCTYTSNMRADPDRSRYVLHFLDCSEFTASTE